MEIKTLISQEDLQKRILQLAKKIKEDYQRYVTENICFLKEGKGSGKRMG